MLFILLYLIFNIFVHYRQKHKIMYRVMSVIFVTVTHQITPLIIIRWMMTTLQKWWWWWRWRWGRQWWWCQCRVLVIMATNRNGRNLNGCKPKWPQTGMATNRRPQTGMATNLNGHKRPQTWKATNQNGHKPNQQQIRMDTTILFSRLQNCVLDKSLKLEVSRYLQKKHSIISEYSYGTRIWMVRIDSICTWPFLFLVI